MSDASDEEDVPALVERVMAAVADTDPEKAVPCLLGIAAEIVLDDAPEAPLEVFLHLATRAFTYMKASRTTEGVTH